MSISGNATGRTYLTRHPHLLYQLLRCDNLGDAQLHRQDLVSGTGELLL